MNSLNVTNLVRALKVASLGAVEASSPVNILVGEVTQINPLLVTVDQRITLEEDFLIIPEQLTPYEVMVGDQTIVIRRGFEVGDSLLLIRMQGGQRFVILDRLVST